jgi:hypothetical protein
MRDLFRLRSEPWLVNGRVDYARLRAMRSHELRDGLLLALFGLAVVALGLLIFFT